MQHTPSPAPVVSPRDAEMDALVEKMVAVHRKYDELKPEHFRDRVAVEAKYKVNHASIYRKCMQLCLKCAHHFRLSAKSMQFSLGCTDN